MSEETYIATNSEVHEIAPVEIAISDSLIVDMVSIITSLFASGSLSAKDSKREREGERER